ncbi:hypothetical protein [Lacticigenium naphthae]|uniref:hypothetical protein n=1 Tax=Lacticigenium naphthae TaxID=515351 RepID=UPI000409DA63|nr:hypothetical protein [Lacticigenium naphthae]
MFKKLVGPLALVSLTLFACGEDTATEEGEDTTAQMDTSVTAESEVEDPNDIINKIKEDSENDEAPKPTLDFSSGVSWMEQGYTAVADESGNATITGYVENAESLYVIENGEVTEELELTDAGDFEYVSAVLEEKQIYLAVDESLEAGQTDIDIEGLSRVEPITLTTE